MAGPASSPSRRLASTARPGSRPSLRGQAAQQLSSSSQQAQQLPPHPQHQLAAGQSPQSTSSAAAPPNKRRRVALACGNCRHRKSRCDGRRPRCSLCTELGCECVYEQAGVANNLTVGRSYLERLEQRLADIELRLAQVKADKTEAPTPRRNKRSRNDIGDDDDDDDRDHDNGPGRDTNEEGGVGQDGTAGSVASSQAATATTAPATTATANSSSSATADGSTTAASTNGTYGVPDTAEDSIDGMGAIKFADEEDWGYFGPSSNIAFLRHISLAMARMDDLHQAMPSPTSRAHEVAGGMSVSRPAGGGGARRGGHAHGTTTPPTMAPVNIYALPSEARTWSLIREYFQKTGRLLPYVHEATFCATYFALKTSNFTSARRTWLGLLNIILAMATTLHVDTSVSAERRIAESDVYYQRANALCDDKEARRNMSLELVQYLLILGQYLQGTQKSVQAWTVHGLAITTALQLGLQSPKTNRAFPPLECEIRKRVWFGCILLDRTLSMTFGRPAMIHESYLTLELPITDMQIVGPDDMQTDTEPAAMNASASPSATTSPQMDGLYFTATIKLYNVLHHIIDTCYGQNLGLEEPVPSLPTLPSLPSSRQYADYSALFSHVLRVEAELEAWKAQLAPNQLSVYDAPVGPKDLEGIEADDKISARYVVVLSVRYHNLQILSHRPILEKLLETCGSKSQRPQPGANTSLSTTSTSSSSSSSSSSFSSSTSKLLQMGLGSVEACIHSAQAIISLVHTIVLADGPRRDLLGAWNFSLFYTFNAALAIFAAMHVARCDVQRQVGDADLAASSATLSRLLPRWEFVEAALPYFGMAIEALENLDRGNRVVERCVSYLSQLVLVPINPSLGGGGGNGGIPQGGPHTGHAVPAGPYGVQNPSETHTQNESRMQGQSQSQSEGQSQSQSQGPTGYVQGYPSHPGNMHSHPHLMTMAMGTGPGGGPGGHGGASVFPRPPQQLLPMEIDLNEFMLDTDFDLLNMAWLSS
ncbi:hypothetical protein HMPREF1624_08622 [Sporothrix schenckii ATCC 58251]|uniref:Zn(2)-C6 fungal-type domain-containing protein n=1 Tax=Sporothrix schenckii (strain ATCC 58251 / de Perez 2211183) TaxID=1391915 RepID=U7PJ35_SPOS1|nr:hypothetical protein HMPREF1624_08622 [Sporothrix schenckii ATCC 58251]